MTLFADISTVYLVRDPAKRHSLAIQLAALVDELDKLELDGNVDLTAARDNLSDFADQLCEHWFDLPAPDLHNAHELLLHLCSRGVQPC